MPSRKFSTAARRSLLLRGRQIRRETGFRCFRSKKTLYRVVRELTGTTPGELRELSPEQADALADAAGRSVLSVMQQR